ncbi:hypothetical protein [Enterobacter hormaechei]|uniref:hypothetical protein n=1 Tax=Enterobacter hormaechei TaxID=158836 RepID=UPI0030763300|nr:hypothetical protein [Enterobacter phage vB_ExiM_F1M1E]UNA03135.1 hypothetical protein [Enterobacter phage vB_ExiM_F2M1E]UNA03456.1 hypothetical protein [Enterobacter phage vB_ExiM_F4M1E]UNA03777.1 hypothetical protein [Enterobacter phage vB_ExiM_F5M1E]UNA04097.1 hypothetical protein [Pantoea phage vB_PdiM_F5M2A]
MSNSNIPDGKVLDNYERQQLKLELLLLKDWLGKASKVNVYTDEYTPWQRVEHSAELTAASHDIEAIEMSLETGRRVY